MAAVISWTFVYSLQCNEKWQQQQKSLILYSFQQFCEYLIVLNSYSLWNSWHFHFLPWTLSSKKKKVAIWIHQISGCLLVHTWRLWGFQRDPRKAFSIPTCGLHNCLVEALKRTGHYSLVLSYSHTFYRAYITFWTIVFILILILPLPLSNTSLHLWKTWAGLGSIATGTGIYTFCSPFSSFFWLPSTV